MEITETRNAIAPEVERRTYAVTDIRIEKGADGKPHVLGHAAVFNSRSLPLKTKGGKKFVEQISPGAFKRALASGRDIVMFYNHDQSRVFARTSTGTLDLGEDEKGLKFDAGLANTTHANDMAEDIRHGNIKGVSFGFSDPEDEWSKDGDMPVRTLKDIPLGEVSPTPFPAYPATDISVRSIDQAIERVEAGETDVRGNMPGYSMPQAACRNAMMACRSAWESIHSAHEALHGMDSNPNAHEARSMQGLHEQAGHLRSKLAELRSTITAKLPSGDDDGDDDLSGDENGIPGTPSTRVGILSCEIQAAAECGLPTDDLRAALNEAMAEQRGGEAVHGPTAARARKAIAAGDVDHGEWSAPNMGDRDQEDCLGAGKSYPIFKGGKVSDAALRNAASRGAQNAPAVGKEASALLELLDAKKDDKQREDDNGAGSAEEVPA